MRLYRYIILPFLIIGISGLICQLYYAYMYNNYLTNSETGYSIIHGNLIFENESFILHVMKFARYYEILQSDVTLINNMPITQTRFIQRKEHIATIRNYDILNVTIDNNNYILDINTIIAVDTIITRLNKHKGEDLLQYYNISFMSRHLTDFYSFGEQYLVNNDNIYAFINNKYIIAIGDNEHIFSKIRLYTGLNTTMICVYILLIVGGIAIDRIMDNSPEYQRLP